MSDSSSQTDGAADVPASGEEASAAPEYGSPREDEVSLLDILLVLVRHRTLIVRTVLAFTVFGAAYALLASAEYTSSATVVREAQSERGGGLPSSIPGGALSSFGISLGGTSSGLTPAAYPDVLQSRAVRLAVVRDTFRFPDTERPATYVDYVNRPPGPLRTVLDYTLFLPWTLKGILGDAISDPPAPVGKTDVGDPVIPTEKENNALKAISNKITASVDEETGLMTISVTAGGPQLAASLAESFLNHFTMRVRTIRTRKMRKQLEFVQDRFREAEQELETAEERLARFLERNQNPTTASLQFQRDRLRRQVSFKEQLYSELQSQFTQTRLDLQRRQPVVTMVETPVPPMSRSAPQRTLLIILSIFAGAFVGIAGAFITWSIREKKDPHRRHKMNEIRKALPSSSWFDPVRRQLASDRESEAS